MPSRHLTKGDPEPPVQSDNLRLFNMSYCPYGQRTNLVIKHLQIPHEEIFFNTKEKPEWIFSKNPLGQAPTMEFQGKTLYESAICSDYLHDLYPDPKLYSEDPYVKARQKLIMQKSDKTFPAFIGVVRAKEEEREDKLKDLYKILEQLETELQDTFFSGANVGMADLHMWPFFERLPTLPHLTGLDGLPKGKFPKLEAYCSAMMELSAVKKIYKEPKVHAEFLKAFLAGKPVFDP